MVTVGGAEFDGNFEIGHGGISFTSEAIEGGEGVVDVIGLGSEFAGLIEAFAGFVPTAQIHHRHAALIMFFRRFGILLGAGLHALFGDAEMGACAVSKFLAGPLKHLFEFLFGTLEFLLVEEGHGLFIDFHLGLHKRINHLDTATLRGVNR